MRYQIEVRGKAGEWPVTIESKAQADAMREDGFEVMEVHNSMPAWVADSGFAGVWCFFQDIWNLPSRIFHR